MATAIPQAAEAHAMRCMEIWGGNQAIDNAVSVPGIDAWVYSRPYAGDTSGGDIHYVSLCGGGKIARFAVADVSGHGASVGEVAVKLRSLMRRHINTVNQTRFIRALNQEFTSLESGGRFATALLSTYYAPNDHLVVCNAGHPAPLWYRAANATWRPLVHQMAERVKSLANLPLGIIEPTQYHQFAVRLEPGDLVLLFTDSLIEAVGPDGAQLGPEGLLEIVRRLDPMRPERICAELLKTVAAYRGGAPEGDDVTVLLLRHNARNPDRQPVGEMIRIVGKMLGLLRV